MFVYRQFQQIIYFGCSKEPSHWDSSFEYQQLMFWLRNKEISFCYTLLTEVMNKLKQPALSSLVRVRCLYYLKAQLNPFRALTNCWFAVLISHFWCWYSYFLKVAIFFCMMGLPIFGNEGSGTRVFKILVLLRWPVKLTLKVYSCFSHFLIFR